MSRYVDNVQSCSRKERKGLSQRAAKGIKQAEYAKAKAIAQIYAVNNIVGY